MIATVPASVFTADAAVVLAMRYKLTSGLAAIRADLVTMGTTCETMLHEAMDALVLPDNARETARLAEVVLHADDELDRIEQTVEERTVRLLTAQQPLLAGDLRLVSSALKTVTDLERIGDLCVNIARTAQRMAFEGAYYQPDVDMPRLGRVAALMLHDTVTAFVRRDLDLARQVIEADDEADVLYTEIRRDLNERMLTGLPGPPVVRASHLLFVGHYLERIGDRCVNIAERVIYTETGIGPRQRNEIKETPEADASEGSQIG